LIVEAKAALLAITKATDFVLKFLICEGIAWNVILPPQNSSSSPHWAIN
jgi:hypothetical protein